MSQSEDEEFTYRDLAALLENAAYSESAAHFHGTLCGALCVLDPPDLNVAGLLEDGGELAEPLDKNSHLALRKLRDSCAQDLLSNDMVFEPLLPLDPAPLRERVEALAAWCGGFLYGLSSRRKLDVKKLSDEARETMRDFSQFTQAGHDGSGDPEAEEAAYIELIEYVRVGAQLLFLELRPKPASIDDESRTVH